MKPIKIAGKRIRCTVCHKRNGSVRGMGGTWVCWEHMFDEPRYKFEEWVIDG